MISQLKDVKKIVAPSSGNHAQGVAAAAAALNISATLVMPQDAPKEKIKGVHFYGGKIVYYDRLKEDRMDIAENISKHENSTIIPPYDHKDIITGQGTVGLEAIDQMKEIGVEPDIVFCCCGGGGLIAGISSALKAKYPDLPIHPVEPENWDDTRLSLKTGKIHEIKNKKMSICDALLAEKPGKLTFTINKKLLSYGITVTDKQVLRGINIAFSWFKIKAEPGGAVALTACLSNTNLIKKKNVLVIVSGGNLDNKLLDEALKTNLPSKIN